MLGITLTQAMKYEELRDVRQRHGDCALIGENIDHNFNLLEAAKADFFMSRTNK